MANQLGSSGTLVGAALESAGYYYHSVILDDLGFYLTHPLAHLIFVLGAIIALQRYVVQQDMKFLRWLLVGPVIFVAILSYREPVTHAEWRFGKRVYSEQAVMREISASLPKGSDGSLIPPAEVSKTFAVYNRIVSGVVQSVVDTLASLRKDIDVKFILRSELANIMQTSKVEEPDFRDLLQTSFLGQCRDLVNLGREYVDVRKTSSQSAPWGEEFKVAQDKRQSLTPGAVRYVEKLRDYEPVLFCISAVGTSEQLAAVLRTKYAGANPNSPVVAPQGLPQECQTLATQDIASASYTCNQIWNFAFTGLYRYATTVTSRIVETGEQKGMAPDDIVSDLLIAKGYDSSTQSLKERASRLDTLYRVTAHYLLRNELQRTSLSRFINSYINRGFEFSILRGPAESDLSFTERERMRNNEWQEKTKMLFTASTLPYYQGMVLYFLALLFPFFALLLVVPGYHSGFIYWFILWLWAKSWDIGFAVVMLFDDVLFTVFSHGVNIRGTPHSVTLDPDLSATMYAFRELDPTMQLGTYYNLMAVALGTIPFVASYLILGSLKGGAGIIASGVSGYVKPFGTRAALLEGQDIVSGTRYRGAEVEQEVAKQYLDNAAAGRDRYANTGIEWPNSVAHIGGVNQRTSPTTSMEQMASEIVQASERAGAAGALASGSGTFSWLNSFSPASAPGRFINQFMSPVGDMLQAPADAYANGLYRNYEQILRKYTESVPYDVTNSPYVQGLHARGAINRQLFIPLLKKTGFREELDHELLQWETEMNYLVSPARGVANAAGRGLTGMFMGALLGGAAYIESARRAQNFFPAPSTEVFLRDVTLGELNDPVGTLLGNDDLIGRGWGPRNNPRPEVHPGLDIRAPYGAAIEAVAPGEVVYAGFLGSQERGWGNTVILRHEQAGTVFYSFYTHGSKINPYLQPGDTVGEDQDIMAAGSTGYSFGSHLHFGISIWDSSRNRLIDIDPLPFFRGYRSATVRARDENALIANEIMAYERRRGRR